MFLGALYRTRYPLHASCKIDWVFPDSCEEVFTKIVDQITAWDVSMRVSVYPASMMLPVQTEVCPVTAADCHDLPCGQQCLYKLTSTEESDFISGTHSTPVSR